jgi:FKBP-type peptidyl-prolyl cis-trans isomerase FklB
MQGIFSVNLARHQRLCLIAIVAAAIPPLVTAQQPVAPDSAPDAAATTSTSSSEPALWQSMETSTDPNDYMKYLDQYHDGPHASQAMLRIESYALGLNYGLNLRRQPVDYDVASLTRGIGDQMAGKPQMDKPALDAAMADLQSQTRANRDRARIAAGEKASYALGESYARTLEKNAIEADPTTLLRGLKDILSGEKPLMTADVAQAALTESRIHSTVMEDKMHDEVAEANRKEGAAFLAANKAKPGVVTLRDGLQYKILKRGTGEKPAENEAVVVNYRGTLLDGTEFNSSYTSGEPATFMIREVIPGWAEALQLMSAGSKWQIFLPPDLAYGDLGLNKDVGPGATVILEVELVDVIHHK